MGDDYQTDSFLWCLFEDWFDPCPYMAKFDGLKINWPDKTFINPPYSNPLPWVKKAIAVSQQEGFTMVLLLKHDSSTEWYRLLHEAGAKFLMINGRLKYRTGSSAPFPSMLAILEGYL